MSQNEREHKLYWLLKKHRIPVKVAGNAMRWEKDWPLDKLMVESANVLKEAEEVCKYIMENENENLSNYSLSKLKSLKSKF